MNNATTPRLEIAWTGLQPCYERLVVLYRGGVGQAEVGVRWPGYFRALHNPDIAQECMSLTRARTRSFQQ